MRRKEAKRQADQPPRANGRTGRLTTLSTTRAKLSSCAIHRRTAAHFNQRSAGLRPSAPRWACRAGLRPAPKGCLAPGQPECSEWATRRESSLLERPSPSPAHSAHDAGHRGSGQRPRGSAPKKAPRLAGPGMGLCPVAFPSNDGGLRRFDGRGRMRQVVRKPCVHQRKRLAPAS